MITLADAGARERALDATQSFIVQAPAGSGKTELLTNSLLVLLARVDEPEEIIAITFTRKAAAEMRTRVLEKLERSAAILAGHERAPESTHEQLTHTLACAVLQRDAEKDWQLRAQAARLRIMTIDALCSALTRQMPYLSRLGGSAGIVDNAEAMYELAARRTLQCLEDDAHREAIAALLTQCDNNAEAALSLLVTMLARRDQWLSQQGVALRISCADEYAFALSQVVQQELRSLEACVPATIQQALIPLAQHAAKQVDADSAIAALCDWQQALRADDEPALWRGVRELLLTKNGELRSPKGVTKAIGFGTDEKIRKQEFVALIAELQTHTSVTALAQLDELPRIEYAAAQWPLVAALLQALKLAAAQLHLLFAERGEIDFVEVQRAALQALGEDDAPTDLLLALDYRIRHLLVDEFQDTSAGQWALLQKLSGGWQHGDGRTLLLVGDPMQSIYRFRKAEVGLFLRAQVQGLRADLPLQNLRLSSNFRSQAGIVAWVNQSFAQVFPAQADALHGTVAYSPSQAVHAHGAAPAVQCALLTHDEDSDVRGAEAQQVLALVQQALARGDESIAVLLRARSHGSAIADALRAAAIAVEAVDIYSLADSPLISDLQQLTRALWHPADRLAWLCVLRAPWCGLGIADLHALCSEQIFLTVPEQCQRADSSLLSADGQQRFARVWPVLQQTLALQDVLPLGARVERCWRALGGEAVLQSDSEARDIAQYFAKLYALDLNDGDVLARIDELGGNLFQQSQSGARVKLMTMHKSKGLEFDTVILPGLGRTPPADRTPLLAWDEYRAGDEALLLIAPLEHRADQGTRLAAFLRAREARRSEEESRRLLYVAATRAKKYLHLIGSIQCKAADDGAKPDHEKLQPAKRSLLALLWPALRADFLAKAQAVSAPASTRSDEWTEIPLQRLPAQWQAERREEPITPAASQTQELAAPFSRASLRARAIGIVTHGWLEQLSKQALPENTETFISTLQQRLFLQLRWQGLSAEEAQQAQTVVATALRHSLADERLRTVLQAKNAQSEWALTRAEDQGISQHIIDRSYVDEEGQRWIVDYKTAQHEGSDLGAFLQRKIEEYRPQMQRYTALLSSVESAEVKATLYFPLQKLWVDV